MHFYATCSVMRKWDADVNSTQESINQKHQNYQTQPLGNEPPIKKINFFSFTAQFLIQFISESLLISDHPL